MTIKIPSVSLVALIGPSGCGKSTFAAAHFKPTEILSSDYCRGLVADDENDQTATKDAFDVLYYIAGKRLEAGRLTVIDATNVKREDRARLLALAREHDYQAAAIVFDLPEELCLHRNEGRANREFGPHVVRQQRRAMRRSQRGLKREGFRHVFTLRSEDDVAAVSIERTRLWTNRTDLEGPFDIIGDVHGCRDELESLLNELGYRIENGAAVPPDGRMAVFLGDLVDRGPDSPGVLRIVMNMVRAGHALCVPGNHDMKFLRHLNGKNVNPAHGLSETIEQFEQESPAFHEEVRTFLDGLVSHYVLDAGRLVVAHAGMLERYQGRASGRVRAFALYGETTGESDEFGLPVRYNWASEYRGKAMVVYGHTPVPEADWLNRTINIDTGCVFGGELTALRYPERAMVSAPAKRTYADPIRPLVHRTDGDRSADLLDIRDVTGKRIVHTRLRGNLTIREDQSAAALELITRFAVDPHWLIYLPPTMSPSETSGLPGLLEHPDEAFAYFARHGVESVVCEEKHMGSRAVVVACKDEVVAARRFGVRDGKRGVCYTRTGRPFFTNEALETELMSRVVGAISAAGLWDTLETDWLCLDCELMPWSAKAQALIADQYASVGAAAEHSLSFATERLEQTAARSIDIRPLLDRTRTRHAMAQRFREAYRHYCWPVSSLPDLNLAPFHVLAGESATYFDRDHVWHMEQCHAMANANRQSHGDDVLAATPYRKVLLTDQAAVDDAVAWWTNLTGDGGEGVVVKPLNFTHKGNRGLVQPALKCRGPEYLRIIYGPEYDADSNLERLRNRGLGRKRSLAAREFALGVEALERFVARDGLYRVHECVFAVLSLESEPVDPRL